MKRVIPVVLISLAILYIFSEVSSNSAAAPQQFAFVDVAKTFDEYQKTKDHDAKLQEEAKKKEDERNVIVNDIRKLKDELELLGEDAKKAKQEKINTRVRELQDYDMKIRQELGQKRQDIVQEIFNDIDVVVKKYGKERKYDFILNDKALLFNNGKNDITADVLKELNAEYTKNKKK